MDDFAPYSMLHISMSNTHMDQEQSIQLIKLYAHYRVLWDTNDPHHNKYVKREIAWKAISEELNVPTCTLKTRMKSLMGSYRSEKSREKKSRLPDTDAESVYESKWFGFKYFDFLTDRENPKDPDTDRDNIGNAPTHKDNTEDILMDRHNAGDSLTAWDNSVDPESSFLEPEADVAITLKDEPQEVTEPEVTITEGAVTKTRSKRKPQTATNKRLSQRRAELRRLARDAPKLPMVANGTVDVNDPYFTYGLNLANELRKYDSSTLSHVKRAISEVFFEADMGRMSYEVPPSPEHYLSEAAPEPVFSGDPNQNGEGP